jgi:hypothetical protein
MNEPARPDLTRMSATMAANHRKAAKSIETLADQIDQLVTVTGRQDWRAVASVCQQLVDDSRQSGYRGISALAQTVCDEAGKSDNALEVKRSLIRLIGTYGRSVSR